MSKSNRTNAAAKPAPLPQPVESAAQEKPELQHIHLNGLEIELYIGKPVVFCYTNIEGLPAIVSGISTSHTGEIVCDLDLNVHRFTSHVDRDTKERKQHHVLQPERMLQSGYFDPRADLKRRRIPIPGEITVDGNQATTDEYYPDIVRKFPRIDGGLVPSKWFDPSFWAWRLDLFLGDHKDPATKQIIQGKREMTEPFADYAAAYKRWWKETFNRKGIIRGRWDRILFVAEELRK